MGRPRMSLGQIWNMCFGFLGIQVGFALQNANASRIFQTLGAEVDHLAVLWIAAPATGLLVQPLVGYFSDRTWGRLGRRRPYFLYGALLTTAALLFMPLAPALWVAAGMLWLMDASINVTMEPFRAFVGDLLPHEQRTTGFAMQSFFIGVGAVFASALPWLLSTQFHVSNVAPSGVVPESVRLAFRIGAGVLFLSVLWTVVTTREYSPDEMARFEAEDPAIAEKPAADHPGPAAARLMRNGAIWLAAGAAGVVLLLTQHLEKELYILAGFVCLYGALQILAGLMKPKGESGLVELIGDLYAMPSAMRRLAVVQFFSWFGLFAMWIYTTPAVAAFHFGALDTHSAAYNRGADWVGVLFGVYNGVAALAAFALPLLAARISRRGAHAVSLILGALGLAAFRFIHDPNLLWISMVGVGVAWASILSMPYSILSSVLPSRKMGVYMGIFNFFIVIPQLVAATILGLILRRWFEDSAIVALLFGAGSMVLAALACLRVEDPLSPGRQGGVMSPIEPN